MSITELEMRCDALRNDLKSWEKQFAAQNSGRRAGREDIKADAIICMHANHCRQCYSGPSNCC
jgi:26S proteasome regulatory subunit N12